jgi:chromosome segregation ATPase
MKTTTLTLTLIAALSFSQAHAEALSASEGLAKLKTNAENSAKNKAEYDKNLEVVNSNVNEIKKTKEATLNQKKNISTELVKNSDSIKKLTGQEKEISVLIEKEKEKMSTEEKQMQQLQALVEQVKKNQAERTQIIADYQAQLNSTVARRNEWKDRENKLKTQENQMSESLRNIATEENTWLGKKATYEKEQKRWTAEAGKQRKIHDTFQGLAEGK